MTKVTNLLIIFLLSFSVFGQKKVGKGIISMNSCEGAVNIFEDGKFHLKFTGSSDKNSLENYASLASIDSQNTLWCSFIAPSSGEVTFSANVKDGYLQMVVFEEMNGDICGEVKRATAEIKRLQLSKDYNKAGLGYKVDKSTLYALSLSEGEKIYVAFATNENEKEDLFLDWEFIPEQIVETESRMVDKRDDDFAPTLSFQVRDESSGFPIIAGLVLEGSKGIEGLYTGSDFLFSITRKMELTVRCDIEGYFFHDSTYVINSNEDFDIDIIMEKIATGKSMNIEEIDFVPGGSEIMSSSEPRLRRLKDFLALNSQLEVEIQGHVMARGKNSLAAQKVSEARAKRVMKYLIDNGIDKKRLTSVGYGNTRPIYEDPTFAYEEQANRRVEIMVK